MNYQIFENLLISHKTTAYQVAKTTGISNTTFTDWKNGRSVPKTDKLTLIADYFGVSTDYLLGKKIINTREIDGYINIKARKMVPVIGEIRAGAPIVTRETTLGYEFADLDNISEYFYLKILGDSMKNTGIINGSLVLFHKQQYADNGDIVACLVGGENATIKRFKKSGNKVYLNPENEDYSPIELSNIDFETGEARILGVATEVKIKL